MAPGPSVYSFPAHSLTNVVLSMLQPTPMGDCQNPAMQRVALPGIVATRIAVMALTTCHSLGEAIGMTEQPSTTAMTSAPWCQPIGHRVSPPPLGIVEA